jgi:hypothetical protein
MKISITKIGLAIMLTGSLFFLINGCKKNSKEESKAKDQLISELKKWAADQPKYTTYIVNQRIDNPQEDVNGNRVNSRLLGTGPGCYPQFTTPIVTFESWAATNPLCSSSNTYQFFSSFLISSENAVVADNPNNASQHTRGRLVVTGTNPSTDNSIPITAITDEGVDPTDNTRRLYRVTWTKLSVPSTVFNAGNTIRFGLYYFTECEEESQYPYAPIANIGNIGGIDACNVVSPLDISPTSHAVLGIAACSCCNPNIMPSAQRIEFSRAGFTTLTYDLGITEVWFPTTTQLPHGYTYNVRYRNIGSNGCLGPWLYPSQSWLWP